MDYMECQQMRLNRPFIVDEVKLLREVHVKEGINESSNLQNISS
jgi:hypothetical protein